MSNRPRVTEYLVHWSGGKMGGFDSVDILLIAIVENRNTSIGVPLTIWKLACTFPLIYEPIEERELRFGKVEVHLDNPAVSFTEA